MAIGGIIVGSEIFAQPRAPRHSATAKEHSPFFIGRGAPFRYGPFRTPGLRFIPRTWVTLLVVFCLGQLGDDIAASRNFLPSVRTEASAVKLAVTCGAAFCAERVRHNMD